MKTLTTFIFLLIGVFIFCSNQSYAQGFSDVKRFEDRALKLFIRGTYVKPDADEIYGGITINGSMAINKLGKGGPRIRYENPTLGDAIFWLARLINKKPMTTVSGMDHAYGSGFFGWMQFHGNVVASDKFLFSAGMSFDDYIIGIERKVNNQINLYDPAGYMFAAGPSVLSSYFIGAGFWIDGYVNYDLVYAKVKYSYPNYSPISGYKKPNFVNFGFDLHHKSGLFGGVRINSLIDRGENKIHAKRMDLSVGYYL